MLFNSWAFACLCLISFGFYYMIPRIFEKKAAESQIAILIISSFIFYGSYRPVLLLLLMGSIFFNALASYFACYGRVNKTFFWATIGVVLNLGILAVFKYNTLIYTTFFQSSSTSDPVLHFLLTIPLPIGISFFTFQGISLVVDAYRDRREGGRDIGLKPNFPLHLFHIALFKSFFPQLVAGPIVKAHDFLPQMKIKDFSDIKWDPAFSSLVTGYFLKMVVADNLKDQTFWLVYPYFQGHSSVTLLALLFGYSMQIFADFAGYSSIAIGLALLFGYEFPKNFYFPYISRSFSEFWTRWHISLSSWLREYLYFPLGGNKKGGMRTYLNLMIVMVFGGLWHGATWSYAIWGGWHGVMLVIERFFGWNKSPSNPLSIASIWRMFFVFSAVTVAWLLFRLPNFSHVIAYAQSLIHNRSLSMTKQLVFNIGVYSLPVVLYHLLYLLKDTKFKVPFTRGYGRALLGGIMLFLIIFNSGAPGAFIYFQF